jgi:guanidinopropionase
MTDTRRLKPMDPSVSPRFGDVATLLRAPRVPVGTGIDIGLVGVPFDLGTNYPAGARGGPAAVREASRTIRLVQLGIAAFLLLNGFWSASHGDKHSSRTP